MADEVSQRIDAPTEATTDAALVGAARTGDRLAFAALYERYARVVHGIMLAHAPPYVVDDLVQDVFERALRQIAKLRDSNAFAGWLIAIARNRVRDHYRRSKQADELQDVPAAERVSSHSEAAKALEAIRQLPETYRETLLLRLVEGLTGPEIAARTGLTHESVRVNLYRGMKMLREALSPNLKR